MAFSSPLIPRYFDTPYYGLSSSVIVDYLRSPLSQILYQLYCSSCGRCSSIFADPASFVSSRGDGVTSAFSKLRPIWISHLYYFFQKMGKLK